ncbi:hypothetical protein HBIAX_05345 [Achromobacter xylosoxidans]|nr:hypothetical protein HBIAX_05345 [Achromobacter xylosoxidans]
MKIEPFFDKDSSTFSYIVLDTKSGHCAIIDSVLGYDPKSGCTSRAGADHIAERVRELGASVQWILETHVHADHLSAAPYLQSLLGGRICIGANIRAVQQAFGQLFNAEPEFARDGRQFDRLFEDGETFMLGTLRVQAMHTPGHTPACMTYVVENNATPDAPAAAFGNVPQTVEGWDGGCGIDYATLRSWSMLDFEGERFRAAASTQSSLTPRIFRKCFSASRNPAAAQRTAMSASR